MTCTAVHQDSGGGHELRAQFAVRNSCREHSQLQQTQLSLSQVSIGQSAFTVSENEFLTGRSIYLGWVEKVSAMSGIHSAHVFNMEAVIDMLEEPICYGSDDDFSESEDEER